MSDPDATWQDHAACADTAVDFFPNRGAPLGPAKAICATCTVADQCLDYALDHGVKHGVWGGTSERDRRTLRKQRRAVTA